MIRLAFVVPRYGVKVLGGAETIIRHLIERLPRNRFQVEVLTTCAQDVHTWENVYPPGPTQANGVLVRRFPIDHSRRDIERYQSLMNCFGSRQVMTIDDEYDWIENSAHSPELYAYLARRGPDYDLLILGPYLFGTTFYGASLWPGQSVIWPALHDEPFAHFYQTRWMMNACRGLMFNCEPELELARRKLGIQNPRACVVGLGLDDSQADPARFRRQLDSEAPFILYAGRLDEAKNVLTLVNYFVEYKQRRPGPLKLVLRGKGPLPIPSHPDILAVGFQNEDDKLDAYAAATLLCQPSLLESFSLVIMESWLAGVPVLVHGQCEVTRYHVLRSNGGLYFTSAAEFFGALDWLLERPQARRQMGALGKAYVQREYNWPIVLERFEQAVATWLA